MGFGPGPRFPAKISCMNKDRKKVSYLFNLPHGPLRDTRLQHRGVPPSLVPCSQTSFSFTTNSPKINDSNGSAGSLRSRELFLIIMQFLCCRGLQSLGSYNLVWALAKKKVTLGLSPQIVYLIHNLKVVAIQGLAPVLVQV